MDRRYFIGGSDARIIMGGDEDAPSGFGERSEARSSLRICLANLVVQLGGATEAEPAVIRHETNLPD
jgi:hypothetical protein